MRNAMKCNRMMNASGITWLRHCEGGEPGPGRAGGCWGWSSGFITNKLFRPGRSGVSGAGGGSRTFPNCFRLNWKVKILRGLVFMSVSIAGLLKQKCLIWWLSGNCVYLSTRELCQSQHFPTICKSEMDSDTSHANKWTEKCTHVQKNCIRMYVFLSFKTFLFMFEKFEWTLTSNY